MNEIYQELIELYKQTGDAWEAYKIYCKRFKKEGAYLVSDLTKAFVPYVRLRIAIQEGKL